LIIRNVGRFLTHYTKSHYRRQVIESCRLMLCFVSPLKLHNSSNCECNGHYAAAPRSNAAAPGQTGLRSRNNTMRINILGDMVIFFFLLKRSDVARFCIEDRNMFQRLRYTVIVRPHDFTFAPNHVFVVTASPFSFKGKIKEEKGMYMKLREIWTDVFLKTPVKRMESCRCRHKVSGCRGCPPSSA